MYACSRVSDDLPKNSEVRTQSLQNHINGDGYVDALNGDMESIRHGGYSWEIDICGEWTAARWLLSAWPDPSSHEQPTDL